MCIRDRVDEAALDEGIEGGTVPFPSYGEETGNVAAEDPSDDFFHKFFVGSTSKSPAKEGGRMGDVKEDESQCSPMSLCYVLDPRHGLDPVSDPPDPEPPPDAENRRNRNIVINSLNRRALY